MWPFEPAEEISMCFPMPELFKLEWVTEAKNINDIIVVF